jgi:hypothetical protein
MTSVPFLIVVYLVAAIFSVLGAKFHKIALLFGCIGGR